MRKPEAVSIPFLFIHSFIFYRLSELLGSRGACAYLRRHRASRQDTPWTECQPIAGHTHTLIHSHTTDNFPEMPINLPCMSLDRGRKPEYPEETPEARGEHANSTHTRRRRESNPQPWRCEANVLTTKPLCPPRHESCRTQLKYFFHAINKKKDRKKKHR